MSVLVISAEQREVADKKFIPWCHMGLRMNFIRSEAFSIGSTSKQKNACETVVGGGDDAVAAFWDQQRDGC